MQSLNSARFVIVEKYIISHIKFVISEDLKSIIEKQNEQLQKQNDEIKSLRKKMDDNDKMVLDFKSELSEVRKKWQSMGDIRSNNR